MSPHPGISPILPKNSSAGGNYERLQGNKGHEADERKIEVHYGMGWKTAFGLHTSARIEARNKEKKIMAIRGIYIHPDHRPGTNKYFQKFWLWLVPFVVWDKDGPKGFIRIGRAMDFYYQVSRTLTTTATASIERSGWFKTPS